MAIDITPKLTADEQTIDGITYKITCDTTNGSAIFAHYSLYTGDTHVRNWSSANSPFPHFWQIYYSKPIVLSEFSFIPTDDNICQIIADYELYCSEDGVNYIKVGSGTCSNEGPIAGQMHTRTTVKLTTPQRCKYVKLVVLSSYDYRGYKWTGIWGVKLNGNFAQHNLYQDGIEVYGMEEALYTKLTDDWTVLTDPEKVALFASTNHQTPTVTDLATLGKFKVLTYAEDNTQQRCSLTAVPKDQLVMPRSLISIEAFEGIDSATLTSTISGNDICKLIVTNDLVTYQAYDFTTKEWQNIDHTDLAAVKASGIDVAALQNIDRAAWDKLLKGKSGIGFAYLMGIDAITDQCAIDQITLQADMKGTWK